MITALERAEYEVARGEELILADRFRSVTMRIAKVTKQYADGWITTLEYLAEVDEIMVTAHDLL